MMCAAALILASLAAASPIVSQAGSNYPAKSSFQGFHMVVNNTDPSRELADPVHTMFLNSIHIGPPYNLVGTSSTAKTPRVFYQNATEDEFRCGNAHILSDGGSPRIPYGLSFRLEENAAEGFIFRLDAGPGQRGVAISPSHHPYAFLKLPGLAICNQPVKYHGGRKMDVLKVFPTPPAIFGRCQTNVLQSVCCHSALSFKTLNREPCPAMSSFRPRTGPCTHLLIRFLER